ncbi:MAG TPA: 3-carboxy-cis,cis-muconate cycloisomerase, partial [Stenotrophomonas sp.]|nr:3-carboxy-cis,cis-muconate cycloisomerase [Stenotrophomonas sp.]
MNQTPSLLGGLFGEPAVDAVFTDVARLQAMLDVEAALARAQARCGVIPQAAVAPIEA